MPNPGEIDVVNLPDGSTITTTWSTNVDANNQPIGNTVLLTPAPGSTLDVIQQLQAKAVPALNNNATYLAIVNPTQAQAVAQVAALTRQVNAIIRLLGDILDSTSGT